jgi:hypothetical protein
MNIYFGRDRQSLFDTNNNNQRTTSSNVRDEIFQREMNIASRFEQTIAIQAAFVAIALCFVLYIGLTGGITDGSDRYVDDDTFDDELFFRYNEINAKNNIQIESTITPSIETQIPSIINEKDNKLTEGDGNTGSSSSSVWL